MSNPSITSVVSDLIDGLERNKNWIRWIGWCGVILAVAFPSCLVVIFLFPVFFPHQYLYANGSTIQAYLVYFVYALSGGVFVLVLPLLAVASGITGVGTLRFLSEWDKKYDALKRSQEDLALNFLRKQIRICSNCGTEARHISKFCMNCGSPLTGEVASG